MKKIRQATEIIAMIERGDLNADLSREIGDVLKVLQELAPPKGKVKGRVRLDLSFSVDGSSCEIEAQIDSKIPKRQRGRSFFFVSDGALSTQHPQQEELFGGPKEVASA